MEAVALYSQLQHKRLQHKLLFLYSSQLPHPQALLDHFYSFIRLFIFSFDKCLFQCLLEATLLEYRSLNIIFISWKERCKQIEYDIFLMDLWAKYRRKTDHLIFLRKAGRVRKAKLERFGRMMQGNGSLVRVSIKCKGTGA